MPWRGQKSGLGAGGQVNLPYLKPFTGSLLLVRQEDDMAHKVPSVSSGIRPPLCSLLHSHWPSGSPY